MFELAIRLSRLLPIDYNYLILEVRRHRIEYLD
jgi:hypothetical protein